MKQRLINTLNRNTFLFLGGLAGVGHETILTHSERPTLLILFAAMMGLPAFLSPISKAMSDAQASEHERREKAKTEKANKEEFAKWQQERAQHPDPEPLDPDLEARLPPSP